MKKIILRLIFSFGLFINVDAQISTIGTNNSGSISSAIGFQTISSGNRSTAMGNQSISSGASSTAMGSFSVASGYRSTAMGDAVRANGTYYTAMGYKTTANGQGSTAMGYETTASGINATAMGRSSTASGTDSAAIGHANVASGATSIALGLGSHALGNSAFAMGESTAATGSGAIAMGFEVVSSGENAVALGDNSTALGNGTKAIGKSSTSLGFNTRANDFGSTVIGQYNALGRETTIDSLAFNAENTAFVVGNGTSITATSDAFSILFNGDTNVGHDLTVEGDVVVNSDRRLKANIISLGSTLAKLLNIDGKSYTIKKDPQQKKKIGLLAQDIKKEFPELVSEAADGILSINYQGLVPVLINAIKEQEKRIQRLEQLLLKKP
jgi:hypothetical protein